MTKDHTWGELIASTAIIQRSEGNLIDILINSLRDTRKRTYNYEKETIRAGKSSWKLKEIAK